MKRFIGFIIAMTMLICSMGVVADTVSDGETTYSVTYLEGALNGVSLDNEIHRPIAIKIDSMDELESRWNDPEEIYASYDMTIFEENFLIAFSWIEPSSLRTLQVSSVMKDASEITFDMSKFVPDAVGATVLSVHSAFVAVPRSESKKEIYVSVNGEGTTVIPAPTPVAPSPLHSFDGGVEIIPPTKTVYIEGEYLDLTGMEAYGISGIHYSDGTNEITVRDELAISSIEPYDRPLTVEDTTVTVTGTYWVFGGTPISGTFDITVLPASEANCASVTASSSGNPDVLVSGDEWEIKVNANASGMELAVICTYNRYGRLLEVYSSTEENADFEKKITVTGDTYAIKAFALDDMKSVLDKPFELYRSLNAQKPSGEGTEENPYMVTTAQELAYIFVENEKYYVLANDIDLSQYSWRPSGFSGIFDGQGHSVTGITVDDDVEYSGFVGGLYPQRVYIDEFPYGYYIFSYIKNLNVEIADSGKGAAVSGGIAGSQDMCAFIENCTVSGDISASAVIENPYYSGMSATAGGIAGECIGGYILDCSSSANVTAYGADYSYAGGIAGVAWENVNTNYSRISGCESTGTVKAYSTADEFERFNIMAGGIAGNNGGEIMNCITSAALYSDGITGGIAAVNGRFEPENCVDNSTITEK